MDTDKNKLKDLGYQHKTVLVEADQYVRVLEHSREKEVTKKDARKPTSFSRGMNCAVI